MPAIKTRNYVRYTLSMKRRLFNEYAEYGCALFHVASYRNMFPISLSGDIFI
jgi:hypothetical protein